VPTLRPMRHDDADLVRQVSVETFADLGRRLHEPERPPSAPGPALMRINHLIDTDPGGAWVAEEEGRVVGAALAIERDGLWGLSLLVVLPDHQSSGLGGALFGAALEYAGGGRRGGVILASPDERALRAYARAGFDAHACFDASGIPDVPQPPPGVRPGDARDLPLTEAVDRAVRGAAHGGDIEVLLRSGSRLFVIPDRGYAVLGDHGIRLLAALDEDAARDLVRACLHASHGETWVEWITSNQQWAIEPALDAGLALRLGGAVFLRGDVGPFAPYLPSGAYL
jgi:GNAT superfamily N-acetyltransferase